MRTSVNSPPSSVLPKPTCELHHVLVVRINLTAFIFSRSSDKYEEQRRHWGGGIRGYKSTQMFRKRAKAAGLNPNSPALGKL